MVCNNKVIMGGRLRRIGKNARRIALPVLFAAFVPLVSSAFPRKTSLAQLEITDPSSQERKRRTALRISASIDIADGKNFEYELCAKRFDVLVRRHRLIHRKNAKKSEKDLMQGLKWDMQVMGEVVRHPEIFSKADKLRIALSYLKSNHFALVKLSKTKPGLIDQYTKSIELMIHPSLVKAFRQWFNNADVNKLYPGMFEPVCNKTR
jgi:hypothetical protein